MDKNKILIVAVADRSGSMSSILNDAIGGFDSMINEQRKIEGKDIYVTLATFDSHYELKTNNLPIKEFKSLKEYDYTPRGCTALYDAIGKTIDIVGEELATMDEDERPSKVLFVVQTDGEENVSMEFSQTTITEMIKHQTDKYNWEFIFLGAGLKEEVEFVSKNMGINRSIAYDRTGDAMFDAYIYTSSIVTDSILDED